MNKLINDDGELQRNKGATIGMGKIVKGTLNEAQIKMRVSSIPNKFQNIIYTSNNQPAFGNNTKRFFDLCSSQKINPGPGQYSLNKQSRT